MGAGRAAEGRADLPLLRLGDSATALRLAVHALGVCRTLADACTLRVIGEIHLADGRLYQARDCLEDSLRRWADLHTEQWRTRTSYTLAKVHNELGDTSTARRMTTAAMETFRTYGAREYAAMCTQHIASGRRDGTSVRGAQHIALEHPARGIPVRRNYRHRC